MTVSAIILAAGAGTRMKSTLPKPLHQVCGRSMVTHVVHSLSGVDLNQCVVVVGHGAAQVEAEVANEAPDWANVSFALQAEQNGTGHATGIGLDAMPPAVSDDETVVVLAGDTPLLSAETVATLTAAHHDQGNVATVLTSIATDPTGLGRVIRDHDGHVTAIVEHRDANAEQLAVDEVNTSIYAFKRSLLGPALAKLDTDNAQGELYLTDVVADFASSGLRVGAVVAPATDTQGVNDRTQLANAEAEMRQRIVRALQVHGVTLLNPAQTAIDVDVEIGADSIIHPGCVLRRGTRVGIATNIGPNTELIEAQIGDNATVTHSVIDRHTVEAGATVGPFAHVSNE